MIKLEKLRFYYRDRVALKDIDLNIGEGESVALIGPNGSGKSTFLRV